MDRDDVIRAQLQERLPHPELDTAWLTLGQRRRQRRRARAAMAAGGVIATTALVVGGLALWTDDEPSLVDTAPADTASTKTAGAVQLAEPDTWRELAPGPLSPRSQASMVWTGTEVVIVGGTDARPCRENEQCIYVDQRLGDGAAYNPATNGWREIADPPFAFEGAVSTWADDVMLLVTQSPGATVADPGPNLLSYDPAADLWLERSPPPVDLAFRRIVWTGDVALFIAGDSQHGAKDWTYDPVADEWAPLAADPIGCSYDRNVALADDQVVLFALPCTPNPGADGPSLYRVAALDLASGNWRTVGDSEIAGGSNMWTAVGDTIVNPSGGHVNGGEVNPYDRAYPLGGIFDLRARTWSDLPPRPVTNGLAGNTIFFTDAAGPWVGADNLLFSPSSKTWHPIPQGPREGYGFSVWTGRELIAWGGVNAAQDGHVATGAAYTPPAEP